ncbi:MAG: hypothetical protein L0Z50_35645, partial [Verrucomicrobiales bacterium]|nr:hypothetical protein [Verrucomicrobiales bacterium]
VWYRPSCGHYSHAEYSVKGYSCLDDGNGSLVRLWRASAVVENVVDTEETVEVYDGYALMQ